MTNAAAPSGTGRLIIVPTPIGHLEDITLRALRCLKEADVIAAEDTRHSKKLLTHYQISKPLISYYKEVEYQKSGDLLRRLHQGQIIALITDAGMPGLSDPGQHLIAQARLEGIMVEVLPGPSAVITALVGSGLATANFSFFGFPDAKSGPRRRSFAQLKDRPETLVFYVSPHKLLATLDDMQDVWGQRQAVLCRELTKRHEEYVAGTLGSLREHFAARVLGEITLIVAGALNSKPEVTESIDEHLRRCQAEGASLNQAVAQVAKARGLARQDVYQLAHKLFKRKFEND